MGHRLKHMGTFVLALGIVVSVLAASQGHAGQRDNKRYDLLLKTSDSWKMVNKEFTVSRDLHSDDAQHLPGKFFHGALLKKEIDGRKPGPVLFHVDFPSPGGLVFFLETVSDTGAVRISLDKKELKTFMFLTGPANQGPWVASRLLGNGLYQCDYNKEYSVDIPAGKHDVVIQNMGTDWLSIGYLVFTEYSDSIVSQEYEDWKSYKTGLDNIGGRLELYREKAHKVYLLEPGDVNYDLTPTLKLQIENLERLAKHPAPVDFNLLRTENELKELLEYVDSGKEYVKLKRGRIKFGYISEIDSTVQPYDVLIPNSYDPSRKYALMLSLHGYQNEIRKYTDLVRDVTKSALDSLGIIKVALYGRRNHSYLGAAEEDVLTVLTRVQARYSIDSDRVYLTGSSMGGYGTWFIGLNYPHLFAAVSPVCAPSMFGGTPFLNSISPIEYISNARNLPARIYHGAMDSTVNVKNSHRMADRLKEMQYDYVYTEYPDVGHDSWNRADADGDRLPWLLKYTRNPYAAQVQHKAFYLRYGRAYWLRITGKGDWNKFSEIQGEITGKNEISIHTNNVSSFSIDARHPSLNPDDPLRVIIDGDSLAIDDHPEGLDFHALTKSEWTAGKPSEKGLVKKLGMEGPFGAVETGPFLLVYGTGRPDKVGLLKHIGTILQNDYSDSDIEPKLVPDTLVIEGGLAEKYHLYLIGSPDENIYLKRIVSRLPVSFSKDSMMFNGVYSRLETGFKMIYPNPEQTDKYILIDKYPEFLPGIDRLVNYPVADYLVYSLKGGRFEVLQDGYFGSDWRVAK